MMERGSIEDHKIIPEQVLQAARSYYENICHFRFHQTIHHLMLAESARICHRAGIKSVHIHCFNDNFYGEHGLWIMNGLHFFAERHSGVDYYKAGRLRNHMDDELNNKLGIWLADRIGYYLDNNLDHQVVFLDHHELG
jgi:hypothetical protein